MSDTASQSEDWIKQLGFPRDWLNVALLIKDSIAYGANIRIAFQKVQDVFDSFCQARFLLYDAIELEKDDEKPEELRLFHQGTLLQSAIMRYASCIDLAWQVMYLRYGPDDPNLITQNDAAKYKNTLGKCNVCSLGKRLNQNKANSLQRIRDDYEKNTLWKKLRSSNNYMKHKGAYHILGIGINPKNAIFSIEIKDKTGKVKEFIPKLPHQQDFDNKLWIDNLVQFYQGFIHYFNAIIQEILPENVNQPLEGDAAIQALLKRWEYC